MYVSYRNVTSKGFKIWFLLILLSFNVDKNLLVQQTAQNILRVYFQPVLPVLLDLFRKLSIYYTIMSLEIAAIF